MLKVDLVVEWIRVSVAAIKNLQIVLSFFDNVFAMLWATHSNLVLMGEEDQGESYGSLPFILFLTFYDVHVPALSG